MLAAKQWLTFTSGAPLQPAVAARARRAPGLPARRWPRELREKRDLLCAGLEKVGLRGRPPEGTYFATTDISELGWPDAMAFCLALPERAGVVAIPTQVFYDDADAGRHLVAGRSARTRDVIEEALTARLGGPAHAEVAFGPNRRVSAVPAWRILPNWRADRDGPSGSGVAAREPVARATGEQQHDHGHRRRSAARPRHHR